MVTFRLVVAFAAEVAVLASASTLHAQSPTALHLTRDLRIDAVESDLTLITPPGGMAVAPNGTIVVSQNQDGTIRFFDASGQSSGTFGRKGQGPGEFQTTGRLAWIGDTLVVTDFVTRRFTLISPDHKLVRTIPWLTALSMPPKSGSEVPRFRVVPRAIVADGSQLLAVSLATGSPIPDWPSGEKPGTPFVRADSSGAFRRLIVWSPRRQCEAPFDAGAGMGSGSMVIPFCPQALEEISPDGTRLSLAFPEPGSAPAFRVVALRANGDPIFSRSYSYTPVAIAGDARDSARATRARGSQSQRAAAAEMQVPESYPPVSRLLVGRDETTWLEQYGAGGQRSWLVLDARGNIIGRAAVPRNTQVMVVSRDAIWAIETDDDGLQHIVRYRLTR